MKRFLALVLSLVMLLTLCPTAWAEEATATDVTAPVLGAIVEGEPNLYFRIGEDKTFYNGMGRAQGAIISPIRFYTAPNAEAQIVGQDGFVFPVNGGTFTYNDADNTWTWDSATGEQGQNYHIYYTDEGGEKYYTFCDIYYNVEYDLLKAGYTAPDIRVYEPEGLEEGVDYMWDYTDGILTVTALKGNAAHWQAAYEAARDGQISLTFTVPVPKGATRAASYCGNGPSMPDYVSGQGLPFEPLSGRYIFSVPFASINEHNGAVTITPTDAYSGVRMAQVFDDSNNGNGVLAKYLVRTRVEVPESFAHHPEYKFRPSFEPQPMPAAGIEVELKSSQNWDVAISDGLVVLTPKAGYTLAALRSQNSSGIAHIRGRFWEAYGRTNGDQPYYLAEHSDGYETWRYKDEGRYGGGWGDGIGGSNWDGRPFSVTFTTTWRGTQGGEIYDYVTVIVTDNAARKPYMSLLPKSQVTELLPSIAQAVPSGGNVTVDYEPATGYFHTGFAEGAVLRPEDVTLYTCMQPLSGAKTYRVMNQEGSRDPREGGQDNADYVAHQIAMEPLHVLENDTYMLNMPLVNYDVMRLDGHDVYFSLTRSYSARTVAWYSDTAGKNLIGYTYIFGHNDDFVCVTTTESRYEVTDLVDKPTLENENWMHLTCELYPTEGAGQFMQLWVDNEEYLSEKNTVYLPFAYFGLTEQEGLALANGQGDLTYAVIRHYNEDYTPKSGEDGLIYGEFTPYGVKFETESFSPFMVSAISRGDVDGHAGLDVQDMQALYEHLSGSSAIVEEHAAALADVNGDGYINILDYQALYEAIK